MDRNKRPMNFRQYVLLIVIAIGLWAGMDKLELIFSLLKKGFALLLPLCVGGCIAFVLNVPMSAMERAFARGQKKRGKPVRKKRNANISLLLTLFLFLLLVAFVVYIVAPQLVSSFSGLGAKINAFYPQALGTLEGWGFDTTSIREFVDEFDILEMVSKITTDTTLTNGAQTVLNTVAGAASSVISSMLTGFIGMVIAIYLLAMKRTLGGQCTRILYAYVKTPVADEIMRITGIFYKTYANFISGQCVEACILGVLFYIVLNIFRFPYSATISVLVAVLAVLPYVGAFISCAVGAFLILMENPMQALIFIVVYEVVQWTENQLIYPRVVGKSVGLPAIWTLLAALVGVNLFGVIGILFFIPLTAVIYQLLRENVQNRLKRKNLSPEDRAHAAIDLVEPMDESAEESPPNAPEEPNEPEKPDPKTKE